MIILIIVNLFNMIDSLNYICCDDPYKFNNYNNIWKCGSSEIMSFYFDFTFNNKDDFINFG